MVHKALKLIRKYHNHSIQQAAELLGVSVSHISEVEREKKTPSLGLLQKYSEAFDLPLSSIMFFAENQGESKRTEKLRKSISGKAIKLLEWVDDISR